MDFLGNDLNPFEEHELGSSWRKSFSIRGLRSKAIAAKKEKILRKITEEKKNLKQNERER